MKISMQYTAQLAMEAGCSRESIDVEDNTTVEEVVRLRAGHFGGKFAEIVLNAEGQPVSTIMHIVNGEQVERGVPHPLKEGDELMLMSPIAGG